MEASTRNLDIDLVKHVYREKTYIVRNKGMEFFEGSTFEDLKKDCGADELKLLDIPELLTEELKVLIDVSDTFYHFFTETLPLIVKLHRVDPSIRFVLYVRKSWRLETDSFIDVLFDVLEELDAKWTVLDIHHEDFFPACRIRNFLRTDPSVFNFHASTSLADISRAALLLQQKYLGSVDTTPWRKIYIPYSPKNPTGFGSVYIKNGSYRDDARMNDEWKIQQYFLDAGYEVIMTKQEFEAGGIAEQIRFMSEVAVLASISSSGLTNMLFMQPGGKVVELAAEVVVPSHTGPDGLVRTKQSVPPYYQLSFGMGHTHVMVPTNRDPDVAIERLKKVEV